MRPSALRTGAGALLAALLLAGAPTFAAPVRAASPSLDDVYGQLGIDEVAADYLILIDMSGSMQDGGLYDGVRRGLREFVAALAPRDNISLISFAEKAEVIWSGPVGRNPDAVVGKLPAKPTGRYTDIGAGIAKAVDLLEKPGGSPIASVVLLTDGRHDPKRGSAFPLTGGYAWRELTTRAGKLPQQITPFAVQLRGANGAPLLRKVFPDAQILRSGTVDQLTERLDLPKAATRAAKARSLLAEELSAEVRVEWPPAATILRHGTNTLPLTLQNTAQHIPVEVSDLVLRSESPGLSAQVATGTTSIPPGGTVSVAVSVTWDAGPASWRPSQVVTTQLPLTLEARIGSSWSETLARELKVDFRPTLSGATTTLPASAQRGSPVPWTVAAAMVLALVGLALLVLWLRANPVPGGILTATPLDPTVTGGSMPLLKRRAVISARSLGIKGSGSVVGRRRSIRSSRIHLVIAYSQDGSVENRHTGECEPRKPVVINKVRFTWQPPSGANASAATPTKTARSR
ncbi:vWA domain-containing protein [Micromonospora sp. DT229]|uniref:vWA domain-containing protein n=1 Tax=Micromonospora sp. DT229 TaxID=3393430 RepID=UPI003CE7133A